MHSSKSTTHVKRIQPQGENALRYTKNKTIHNYIEKRLLELNLSRQYTSKTLTASSKSNKSRKVLNKSANISKGSQPKQNFKQNVLKQNNTTSNIEISNENLDESNNEELFYNTNSSLISSELVFLKAENLKLRSILSQYKEQCAKLQKELDEIKKESKANSKNFLVSYNTSNNKNSLSVNPIITNENNGVFPNNELNYNSTINSLTISDDES